MAPKTMKAKAAMKAMKAAKVMSKGALATELAEAAGLKKGEVTKVLDSLAEIGTKEVKKAGKFTLPGLCMIKTRKKKAPWLQNGSYNPQRTELYNPLCNPNNQGIFIAHDVQVQLLSSNSMKPSTGFFHS